MSLNPILLIVWAVLAVCFLALLVYRGQLTRYEDEQLFLSDETNLNAREQQSRIVHRVHKLKPLVTTFGAAAGLVTASVVGLYVWQAWQTIH